MSHIKRLSTSKADPVNSDRNDSIKVPLKKKARNGVLPDRKQQEKKTPKYHGSQRYCILCKKAVIPESKWKSNSSKKSFVKRSNKENFKDGLGGALSNRDDAVKHYQKYKKKLKRELKYHKKQTNMLFSMAKNSVTRREIKNTKEITSKVSKKRSYSIKDSSISD